MTEERAATLEHVDLTDWERAAGRDWNRECWARYYEARERNRQRKAAGLPTHGAAPDPCPDGCHGAGVVLDSPFDAVQNPFPALVACQKCGAGGDAERRREARLLGGSDMEDFRHITFENTRATAMPDQHDLWRATEDWARTMPGWLWMYGGFKRGKTVLARCIANAMLDRGQRAVFRKVPRLLNDLRDTYGFNAEVSFSGRFEAILTAPLLVLDELGQAKRTDWVVEVEEQLTDYRLERHLPTVVTTNLDDSEMERTMPRLLAHITDNSECLMMPFANEPWVEPEKRGTR